MTYFHMTHEKTAVQRGEGTFQCHRGSNIMCYEEFEPHHLTRILVFSLTIDATHLFSIYVRRTICQACYWDLRFQEPAWSVPQELEIE